MPGNKKDELSQFITNALRDVTKGVPDGFELSSPIKFEIAVVNEREAGGGIKILVATIGATKSKEESSRISFEVSTTKMMLKGEIRRLQKGIPKLLR